jgi:hypothetical protein
MVYENYAFKKRHIQYRTRFHLQKDKYHISAAHIKDSQLIHQYNAPLSKFNNEE